MEGFNNPYIDKLVGVSEEQRELVKDLHEYIIETIETIGGEKINNFEIEKTKKDVALIEFTEQAVDRLLKKYGRIKEIKIPKDNIHLLKPEGTEKYTNGRLIRGAHSSFQQSILIDRDPSDIQFTLELFHELLHVKSYTAFQVVQDDNTAKPRIGSYRTGIRVVSRDGRKVYLQSAEEAVIGCFTNVFYESLYKEPMFKNDIEKINKGEIVIDTSRQKEVTLLNVVIDKLYESNKSMFSNREDVLNLFIDAQVNGNLLPVGKLIEKTFGPGTLKKIDYQEI